jgi:competence protein ComEC
LKRILFTSAFLAAILLSSCAASVTSTISNANTLTSTTQPQTSSPTATTPAPTTISTTSVTIVPNPTGQELDVHFINVGEGDSILIDCGPTDVLIDGGEESANVADLIKPYVHGDIEAVIATHYHADHIGGLIDVFKDYHVDNAFWNGEVDTTLTYLNWKQAMDTNGVKEQIVKRDDVIQEGILTFNVLDPVVTTDADPDQDCIVLSLQYGSKSFLFMADDGKPAEDNLLAAGLLQHYNVLKVGHHGSDTASSQEFLNVVKPDIAVYECGLNDQYGFPKADVISRLKQIGAVVYGTDTSDTIELETNGLSENIQTGIKPQSMVTTSAIVPSSTTASFTTTATPYTTTTTLVGALSLQVVSVTSPVTHGANVTLIAKTTPGAQCTIIVNYKSGASTASGLEAKTADNLGNVSWTWKVGANTSPGTWTIVCTATLQGNTVTTTTNFMVN